MWEDPDRDWGQEIFWAGYPQAVWLLFGFLAHVEVPPAVPAVILRTSQVLVPWLRTRCWMFCVWCKLLLACHPPVPPTYRCDSKRSTQYIIADNLLNRAAAKRITLWSYQPWDKTKWACLRVSRSLWEKKGSNTTRGNTSLDVFEVQNASKEQK